MTPNRPVEPLAGWRGCVLLALALLLAILGQLSFASSPPFVVDGLVLYVAAILLFTRAFSDLPAARRPLPVWSALRRHPARAGALVLALLLSGRLLASLAGEDEPENLELAVLLWLGSIAAATVGVGVTLGRGERQEPLAEAGGGRWVVPGVLSMLAVASLLRLWRLGSIPWTIGGDEGSFGLEVAAAAAGSLANPWATGWSGQPTMLFFFGAPSLAGLGQDSVGLRLPWAVLGSLTVPLAYLLVAQLHGRLTGFLTATFVATWGFHIHYSRLGLGLSGDAFLATLALLLLVRSMTTGSRASWVGAGLVTGLSLYGCTGARLVPFLVAFLTLLEWLRRHRGVEENAGRAASGRGRFLGGALAMTVVAFTVAAPMLQYAVRHPDRFNARINAVGVFQSGWLEREVEGRQTSEIAVLADQFQRALLAFNLYPDRMSFYAPSEPLLGFSAGVLFMLGLGYSTLRCFDRQRRERYLALVVWWWGGLAGSVLTVNPPETQRLVILAVPSAFFVAIAIQRVSAVAAGFASRRATAVTALALTIVIVLGVASTAEYFVSYTPSLVYGNPNAVVATRLGRYAREKLPPGSRVVFFGAPRMYSDFGSFPYLAPHVEREDVVEPLQAPPPPHEGCGELAFVLLPERAGELELVRQSYPSGTTESVSSPAGDATLFLVHRVVRPCPEIAERAR